MKFSDYLRLAFRNIRRQKLRSALTIFAVVIGATSVTIMLALVTGAKGFFLSQVEQSGLLEQVAVSRKADISDFNDAQHSSGGPCGEGCVKITDALTDKIKAVPHVVGAARVINDGNIQAISLGAKKLSTQQITAYDANGIITSVVLAGRDIGPADKTGVITVTADYADKFGFKNKYQQLVGQTVSLETRPGYSGVGAKVQPPQQCSSPCNNQPDSNQQQTTTLMAKIVGVIETGDNSSATIRVPLDWMLGMEQMRSYQQDPTTVQTPCHQGIYCPPPTQHLILQTTSQLDQQGYGSLIVKADISKNAPAVAAQIRTFGVGAADAKQSIQQQLTIFNIMGLVLGGIGGIALVVAAIGVVNTMIMAILERTREIGVMRAVGAKRSTVRALFTFEASMLGLWGGIVGVLVGFGLTKVANIFVNKQLVSQGVKASNIIGLPLWLVLTVIGIATLIGMLAGLYPASRAAKLDPVEALRYE